MALPTFDLTIIVFTQLSTTKESRTEKGLLESENTLRIGAQGHTSHVVYVKGSW